MGSCPLVLYHCVLLLSRFLGSQPKDQRFAVSLYLPSSLLVPERLRVLKCESFFSVVKVCKHWLVEEQYVWRRVATQISTLAWSSGQSAGLEARKSRVRVPLPAVWNPRPRSVNSQLFFVFVFVCDSKCVSVACLNATLSATKSMTVNTVAIKCMDSSRSRSQSLTVCFSFCSAVFSVHVYSDRGTLLQFSHY